jgi:hypothetical protein
MASPEDVPSIAEFEQMLADDEQLQIVPPGEWSYEAATAVLDVHPSNTHVPYWRAVLRDDDRVANRRDVIRFVATRLRQVGAEGFPPRDFVEHKDGWYRITMTVDGTVGDYVPGDWE